MVDYDHSCRIKAWQLCESTFYRCHADLYSNYECGDSFAIFILLFQN